MDTAHPVTRRQLRLQLVDGKAVVPDEAVGSLREPLPGGRRDRRRQGRRTDGGPAVEPVEPDPAVLAQQRALAARAAELAARARRVRAAAHDLTVQPAPEDPAAAHNLAVLASPGFFLPTDGAQAPSGSTEAPVADTPVPATPARSQEQSPSPTRTGSTASARREPAAPGPNGDTDPIAARSAFGLDPLDAMTAGLGRMRRLRYALYSLLVVGAAALVTGIMMIVSSLNG